MTHGEEFHAVRLYFATNRGLSDPDADHPADQFDAVLSDLKYGVAEVSIPVNHQMGHLEDQGWLESLFVAPDPRKHVILQSMDVMPADDVMAEISEIIGAGHNSTLLYIHGFNVGVDTAARRAGQLTYDLNWTGPSFFFSWPSQNSAAAYVPDLGNARASRPALEAVLERPLPCL